MSKLYEEILYDISQDWLNLLLLYPNDKKRLENICSQVDVPTTLPSKSLWFEWARLIQLKDVKVIIIGQDPYPNPGDAHGLAFSCKNKIPASLLNIYKCLKKNGIIKDIPKSGDLTPWASNGILLLNTALTVEHKKAGAHIKIWYEYMRRVLFRIQNYHRNIDNKLFILTWGNFAQKFGILNTSDHIYMAYKHPSPLAGKWDCSHFNDVNEYLENENLPLVDWGCISNNINESIEQVDNINESIEQVDNINKSIEQVDSINKSIEQIKDDADTHIFSDGSCEGNGKKNATAGFSLLFTRGVNCGVGYYGRLRRTEIGSDKHVAPSNIRAEGMAILIILQKLQQCDNWNVAKIHTDSQFWIKMILEYMPKWSSDKFETKKNTDLSLAIWKEWCKCAADKERRIHLQFVRAHRDEKKLTDAYDKYCCKYNNLADIWAKKSLELIEGEIKEFKL